MWIKWNDFLLFSNDFFSSFFKSNANDSKLQTSNNVLLEIEFCINIFYVDSAKSNVHNERAFIIVTEQLRNTKMFFFQRSYFSAR